MTCAALAAPPTVDIPADTKASSEYVIITPKTDAKGITYIGMSGVSPLPNVLLTDKKIFCLPVRGLADGTYKFKGVASLNDEHTEFGFTVTVGAGGDIKPVPPVPPDPNPKPNPDITKVDSVWVIVVEDGSRTIETAKLLNDDFWTNLRPRNDYRQYTTKSAEAIANKYVEATKDVGYPAALILDAKDGNVLKAMKLTKISELDSEVKARLK